MAKYTENFNLIKPEDDEYYDVTDFNENMDIIDEALAESAGGSDKIGEPEDSILSTVFGKLNAFISPDGKGVRIIKSIQHKVLEAGTDAKNELPISPVDASRSIVLMERLYTSYNYLGKAVYTLFDDKIQFSQLQSSEMYPQIFGFWIIEFY